MVAALLPVLSQVCFENFVSELAILNNGDKLHELC